MTACPFLGPFAIPAAVAIVAIISACRMFWLARDAWIVARDAEEMAADWKAKRDASELEAVLWFERCCELRAQLDKAYVRNAKGQMQKWEG